MASRRQVILVEFLARVSEIKQSNGFQTDAGFTPFLGEGVVLGESDPEVAVSIVVRDDLPGKTMENIFIMLPIEVQAIAKADINQPWLAVEALIADIKQAIELPDRTLGLPISKGLSRGSTRTLAREAGAATVGAAVTYVVPYVEAWGAP